MPTQSARVKRYTRSLGTRESKINTQAAFEAGVRACLGSDAPLQSVPFRVKLDIIYRTPETHIKCFASDTATFTGACSKLNLTEDVATLFSLVHRRLIGAKSEASTVAAEALVRGKLQ